MWCSLRAGRFSQEPAFTSTNVGGRLLDVRFEHSAQLWPWSGFLALYIRIAPEGATYKVQLDHLPSTLDTQELNQPCMPPLAVP